MRYIIRVKGHLDPIWQDWLENLTITHESEGTTLLSGPLPDQAALYGILFKILNLGLPLLELRCASVPTSPEDGLSNIEDAPPHSSSDHISSQ